MFINEEIVPIIRVKIPSTYSQLPNSSGGRNKCMVAYNFFDLLHENARFWSFLTYFCAEYK